MILWFSSDLLFFEFFGNKLLNTNCACVVTCCSRFVNLLHNNIVPSFLTQIQIFVCIAIGSYCHCHVDVPILICEDCWYSVPQNISIQSFCFCKICDQLVVTAVVVGRGEAHQLCPGSVCEVVAIVRIDVHVETYPKGWAPRTNGVK